MSFLKTIKNLTSPQRSAVIASFLGWTLDAFDFFIVVFVLNSIAGDFHSTIKDVSYAITLTLAMRPLGAFIFGWLADRYGRHPVLMADILLFSLFELGSACAPNLTIFLILRAGFGIAMGGEWGVGSSLVMETIPAKARGIISGFLQQGYAVGYLCAAIVFWLAYPLVGWRGMFVIGVIPALLVLYIRSQVAESPVWVKQQHRARNMLRSIADNWKLFIYVIILMACFNAFSHGTQDLYPTFLQQQHNLDHTQISLLTIIANLGAIAGGITFGILSERIGRRRAIVLAAACSLAIIYVWAYSTTIAMLACGAFFMQFTVQGAWGVIPAHLNELSPSSIRGTFPGFTYQLGNFLISMLAPYQVELAASHGGDYSFALATSAIIVALITIIVVGLGHERKGVSFNN